jgi:hypothetical protein
MESKNTLPIFVIGKEIELLVSSDELSRVLSQGDFEFYDAYSEEGVGEEVWTKNVKYGQGEFEVNVTVKSWSRGGEREEEPIIEHDVLVDIIYKVDGIKVFYKEGSASHKLEEEPQVYVNVKSILIVTTGLNEKVKVDFSFDWNQVAENGILEKTDEPDREYKVKLKEKDGIYLIVVSKDFSKVSFDVFSKGGLIAVYGIQDYMADKAKQQVSEIIEKIKERVSTEVGK